MLLQQRTLLLLLVILLPIGLKAQMPECDKYYRRLSGSNRFQTIDPATNSVSLNSILLPAGAAGLAVGTDFFGPTPSFTFYTTVSGNYHYYDGSSWVNTGHSTGSSSAVNPGGSASYIYNLSGISKKLFRYDGNGDGTLFLDLGTFSGPFDVMGDSEDNVYVLQAGNPQALNMYDPNGNLTCAYDLVGLPAGTHGGGYSIVDGIMYANLDSDFYTGTISGNTITFVPTPASDLIGDYANCPFPPINLTIETPDTLSCDITSIQLSAISSVTNPQFSWSGPGIVSGGSTSSPIIDQPGVYTVTVNSTGGGCSGDATQQVTVVEASGLSLSTNITKPEICEGDSSIIEIIVAGSNNPYTYSWDNNLPAGNSNAVTPTTTTTYTINVEDNTGCSSSISATIEVNQNPSIDAGPDQAICHGNEVTLNGSGAGTGGTYSWNNGVTDGVAFTPNSGTTTFTLIGTDTNGCENTDQIDIINPEEVEISIENFTNVSCDFTNDGEIAVNTTGGSPSYSYTINGSTPQPSPIFDSLTVGQYEIIVEDSIGCSDTIVQTISQATGPTINLPDTIEICLGESWTPNAAGAESYIWTDSLSNGEPVLGELGTEVFVVTGTSTNGCSTKDSVTVITYNNPDINFTADTLEGLTPLSVTFENTSTGGDNYFWNFGDGTQIQDNNNFVSHIFVNAGTYPTVLTGSNQHGCIKTATITIKVLLPETNLEIPNIFTPNGDLQNDNFKLINYENIKELEVVIVNRWGNLVFESNEVLFEWNGKRFNSGAECSDGIYFYIIKYVDVDNIKKEKHGFVHLIKNK